MILVILEEEDIKVLLELVDNTKFTDIIYKEALLERLKKGMK